MRSAIKRGAQGACLILEAIEHIIDRSRERMEFIVRTCYRQPPTQLARENAFAGARYITNTARQPVAEPESGQRRRQGREADAPEHRDTEFLGEAASLGDVGTDEQVI